MEQRIYETRIITLAISRENGIEFLVSLSPRKKINNPYYKLREFYLEKKFVDYDFSSRPNLREEATSEKYEDLAERYYGSDFSGIEGFGKFSGRYVEENEKDKAAFRVIEKEGKNYSIVQKSNGDFSRMDSKKNRKKNSTRIKILQRARRLKREREKNSAFQNFI